MSSIGAELDKTWQLHKVLHPSGGQIESCIFHKWNSLPPSRILATKDETCKMHHEMKSQRRHAVTQRANFASNADSRYVGTSTLNTLTAVGIRAMEIRMDFLFSFCAQSADHRWHCRSLFMASAEHGLQTFLRGCLAGSDFYKRQTHSRLLRAFFDTKSLFLPLKVILCVALVWNLPDVSLKLCWEEY